MSQAQIGRPWREIARELTQESDSRRISELSSELDAALEAQGYDEVAAPNAGLSLGNLTKP